MGSDKSPTRDAIAIWEAGVRAVLPETLFQEQCHVSNDKLSIGDLELAANDFSKLIIVGAGKASASMAMALQNRLPKKWFDDRRVSGWVNVPEQTVPKGYSFPVVLHQARPYGINEPTHLAMAGAQKIQQIVSACHPDDLVICLLSGGGSALLPLPRPGIDLELKRQITQQLSSAGATIEELNTVRTALSDIKGGGLARSCSAGLLLNLVISDVLGDDLRFIASGPSFIGEQVGLKANDVLVKFFPNRKSLPEIVWAYASESESVDPMPKSRGNQLKCHVEHVILANNATAVDAAGVEAVARGYRYLMNSARKSEGDAASLGQSLMENVEFFYHDPEAPDCLITGGEPTVSLVPANIRGKGGRNQHLTLAALLKALPEKEQMHKSVIDLCFLSAGTDGEDGPTDAAGAFFNLETLLKENRTEAELHGFLDRNDSNSFFEHSGGLLRTGPTGTNVCDLRVACWEPIHSS